ncbi:MAG: Uncharacterized protein CEO21_363 [Microgenomates group bacterium Gr01-1014_80]|nr:MAG: Uncharacterized protein CEO21_363 [Microgenomates group bacterium Gr01-1014_80]
MKGITFIELILVLAIMLTLSMMTPTFYSRFLLQNSVADTTDQLVGSLRKAQIYSMAGKQNSAWSVNYSNYTITLYRGNDFINREQAFDEKFSVNTNVTVSDFIDLNFAKITGIPSTGNPSLTPTITISGGNNTKTVAVNSQGVIDRVSAGAPTPTPTLVPGIQFIGTVSNTGKDTTSSFFSLPAGWQPGDVAVFWWYTYTDTKTITPPAALTQKQQASSAGFGRIYIGYRVLQSGDTTFAWTASSATNSTVIWGASVFSGVNATGDPFEATSGAPVTFTDTLSPNPPAVTTLSNNAVILPVFGKRDDYTTINPPTNYTTAGSNSSTAGSDSSAGAAYFQKVTPGSEDPGAWSLTGGAVPASDGYVWTGVLKP